MVAEMQVIPDLLIEDYPNQDDPKNLLMNLFTKDLMRLEKQMLEYFLSS